MQSGYLASKSTSFPWISKAFFMLLVLPSDILTSPIVYSASTCDGSHSLQLHFSWYNCPLLFYPFVSKFFPDVEIFEVFCDNITPMKLQTSSLENPRYHVIIYSSWPNICIHSLEVAKVY